MDKGRARLTGCRKMEEREATKWVNETRINNQSREEALSQLLLAFVQRGPLQLVDPVCYILIIWFMEDWAARSGHSCSPAGESRLPAQQQDCQLPSGASVMSHKPTLTLSLSWSLALHERKPYSRAVADYDLNRLQKMAAIDLVKNVSVYLLFTSQEACSFHMVHLKQIF